jgi:ATP-binding cassette subfamily B protein
MKTKPHHHSGASLWHELRVILKRGRQVWRLVSVRHRLALAGAAVLMAVTSVVNTTIPLFLGKLVDQVKTHTESAAGAAVLYHTAALYLGLIGGAYVLREGLQVVRRYFVEGTCTRIDRDMTIRLVSHLLRMDLGALTHEKVGALHGRLSRSTNGFVLFLRLAFLTFVPAVFTGAFALAAAAVKQPWVGLVMAGVIPTAIFLTVWQIVSQKGVRLQLLRSKEEMDGTVVEQLTGLDYVRAADTHDLEVKRVARIAERARRKEMRHHFQMSLFGCAKALNEGLFHILVLSLGVYLAVQGRITFGDILTFSMLFLSVMAPLSEIHRVLDEGHEYSLQVGDLLEMLAQPVDRSFAARPADKEPRVAVGDPVIEAEDLHVVYHTADGRTRSALEGVSLVIRHGEKIGIAGRTGCGKSTWLKVWLRLTHPSCGRVLFGGVPLEEVSRESIGRLIGYVSQSPFVFAGTVAENIAYGTQDATPEAIRRAAERACIHEEILAMPHGYDSLISERGQNLSGGQRQRIALARLFLRDLPILILDEGTSALDTISERNVQRALAAARADRTVILVAHRLSTLLDCDRILVFDAGKIVETGTYQELLDKRGVFTELILNSQSPQPAPAPDAGEPALAAN